MHEDKKRALLLDGIELFNQGRYFQAHEVLEELWRAEAGHVRVLYQGLIQVAVGLEHLRRGNRQGALALLERGALKLDQFVPCWDSLDIAALARDTRWCGRQAASLPLGGLDSFPWDQAPIIRREVHEPSEP